MTSGLSKIWIKKAQISHKLDPCVWFSNGHVSNIKLGLNSFHLPIGRLYTLQKPDSSGFESQIPTKSLFYLKEKYHFLLKHPESGQVLLLGTYQIPGMLLNFYLFCLQVLQVPRWSDLGHHQHCWQLHFPWIPLRHPHQRRTWNRRRIYQGLHVPVRRFGHVRIGHESGPNLHAETEAWGEVFFFFFKYKFRPPIVRSLFFRLPSMSRKG